MSLPKSQPGADAAAEACRSVESSVRSYSRTFPQLFESARDSRLYTSAGEAYLDFLMGCSSLNYGHNHPALKKALLDYIEADGVAHGLDLFTQAKEQFLHELTTTILEPRNLDYVVQFPGPTGANAVEAALKLARKITGRQQVIAFTNAFHGVTLGALACTANQHHRGAAGTSLEGVARLPYDGYFGESVDTAAYLEQMLSDPSSGLDEPAAIILETVQGEGGLNAASDEWLRRIARICRLHGALLIVDDIQAGVGRTGTFFSFEPAGIKPDIVTMAKSLSGYGLPMSIVLIDPRYDAWAPGEHNGTFRGNCHAFVTAAEALRVYWRDEKFTESIREKSVIVDERFRALESKHEAHGVRAKGRGMMRGLQLPSGDIARTVVKEAFGDGLIVETSGPNDEVVKCLAALTISESDLLRGLEILGSAIDRVMHRADRAAA